VFSNVYLPSMKLEPVTSDLKNNLQQNFDYPPEGRNRSNDGYENGRIRE
jgi:hypothetical protein